MGKLFCFCFAKSNLQRFYDTKDRQYKNQTKKDKNTNNGRHNTLQILKIE